MRKVKSFNNFINEGVRDSMTPKSKEDIKKSLENSPALTVLNGIKDHNLDDVYTEDEIKELKNKAKRYLNRLSIEDRLEKVFDEMDNPLSIYTESELKRLLDQVDDLEDELATIDKHKLFHLFTKDELKDMLDKFQPWQRFGMIDNYNMEKLFTKEELEEYMNDSDSSDIYNFFKSMVRKNNFEEVKKLIDKWNINFHSPDANLTDVAIMSGNLEMVQYLIEKGMKVALDFEHLFSIMTRDVNKDIIKFILSKSPELQTKIEEKKRKIKWDLEILEKYS